MSFRNGLKAILAGTLGLTLAACSNGAGSSEPAKEQIALNELSVLCPTGAPALSIMGLAMSEEAPTIEYVEGQDVLVSELSKTDSQYDLIVAPVNAGVKTWSAAGEYQLEGILTWGNLYIVSDGEDWNAPDKTLAAFGESAVPGMVFKELFPETECTVDYYPSVAEASAALLSGKADVALLAQPAAAGALAKANENGRELSIVGDLQKLWAENHEVTQNGYPQAALFVKKEKAGQVDNAINAISDYISSADEQKIETDVNALSAERFGVPNATLAAKTWKAQNIHFEKASEVESDLQAFLNVFGIELPEDMIVG